MNFLEQFWYVFRQQDKIDALFAEKEKYLDQLSEAITKVKALNDIVYNTKKDTLELIGKKIELENEVADLHELIAKKDSDIDSLKTELALKGEVSAPVPAFIENKPIYTPYMNSEGNDIYLLYSEIYDMAYRAKNWVVQNKIRGLPKNQKLIAIWGYVVNAITYEYDKVDNWQPFAVSAARGRGDCEDGSIMFVTLCSFAGLRPDEVFNAVGPTDFGYHSYPIVKFDKDDTLGTDGESFYICESTLDYLPPKPMKLKGSKYHTDSGGIANWSLAHCGRIKPEFALEFNGVPGAIGGDEKQRAIENSEEKRQAIIDHWKKQVN